MAVAGYSRTQIALHWIVAGLIAVNIIFEDGIKAGWEAIEDGGAPVYDAGVLTHIGVGVAVLALACWRLSLRFTRGVPDLPAGQSAPMRLAAHLGHWALYAAMIMVPVVGLMAWFGASEALAELHELGKPVFIVLVAGHVAAALWHQFVRRDGLMDRMRKAG
jgi:cytochrome b561